MRFEGIYTPVITPYRRDGSVNEEAYLTMLEYLIEQGTHGIVVAGSTGEYFTQSAEERIHLAQIAKKQINGRLPLIVGVSSMRTDDAVKYANAARELGADAILLGSPPYAEPTERENAMHALAVDRAAGLPIMLYNYPHRMAVNMGEEFLSLVSRSPNFVAIKESSGSMERVHLLAREFPHIQISCGSDHQVLEYFAWGARSWVCAAANCLPKECVALYTACVKEKDFDKGRRIMSAFMPLMRVFGEGGKFLQCIKHMCQLQGIDAGYPRAPLRGINKDERREIEAVVRVLKRTIEEIQTEA